MLGEESVGIVFELVFRDIKMLSRTALQRPWPVVFELAQERLDMVVWFARYKADQCNLRLHDEVARSLDSLPAPRRVKSVLAWHRAGLKTQLVARRKDLEKAHADVMNAVPQASIPPAASVIKEPRPPDLPYWKAYMDVDPSLSEQEARELAFNDVRGKSMEDVGTGPVGAEEAKAGGPRE